jgi:hypothetical protein
VRCSGSSEPFEDAQSERHALCGESGRGDVMTSIELSDEEVALVRSALESYLAQFGHEEQDTVTRIQRLYVKLGGELSKTTIR